MVCRADDDYCVVRQRVGMANNPIAPLGGPSPAEETFKVYSKTSLVRFLTKAVQPPSALYVDTSDVLQVGCATTQTNETVTISYRLLRSDGQLVKGQFQLFPTNSRALVVKQEPLAEGFLLSVSCKAARAATRGQTFVRVFLTDPALGGGQPSYMLMADYVTTAMAPAHPNGRVLAPIEGPGALATPAVSSPGAGLEWTVNVPLNTRWKVWGIIFQLVTSAAGSTRIASVTYNTGIGQSATSWATTGQPVSTHGLYDASDASQWSPQPPTLQHISLPQSFMLESGCQIHSLTANIDPGDQYALNALVVEEWLLNV